MLALRGVFCPGGRSLPPHPTRTGIVLRTNANVAPDSPRMDGPRSAGPLPGALAPSVALVFGALAIAVVGYLLLPLDAEARRALSHACLTAFPLLAGVACLVAALASAGLSRVSWLLFGGAALSAAAGRAVWMLHDYLPTVEIPYPTVPLTFFLLFHPLFAAGALLLLRRVAFAGERATAALDAALILAAALVLVLRFVAEPVGLLGLPSGGLPEDTALLQAAASILSLSVAGLLLVWRVTALPPAAVAGLSLAAGAFAMGGFVMAGGSGGLPRPGAPFDLLLLCGWTAILLSGLVGASGQPAAWTARIGTGLVALLRQAVVPGTVLALGVIAIDATFGPGLTFPSAVTVGVLCGLLVVRTGVALYQAERRTGAAAELAQSRALIEVSHALAGSTELDNTLRLVSEWTSRLLGARAAGIQLLSPDGRWLEIRAIAGDHTRHLGFRFPVDASFTGRVVRDGTLRATSNAAGDPAINPDGARLLGSSPLAAAPLRLREDTLGTLFVVGMDGPFSAEQLDLLQAMAEQAAVGIQNARLFEEVRKLSFTDPLTGLANRRQLDRDMQREFSAAQRGRRLTLVIFDIDDFKGYNDALGHVAGDAVLRAMGAVLQAETRAMNMVARFGGDEFVALLSETDRAGGLLFVRRVIRRFAGEVAKLGGHGLNVSAGVAEYAPDMERPEALLDAADRDLYRSKEVRTAT